MSATSSSFLSGTFMKTRVRFSQLNDFGMRIYHDLASGLPVGVITRERAMAARGRIPDLFHPPLADDSSDGC